MKPVYNLGFDLDGVVIDHTKNKIRAAGLLGVALAPQETPSDIMNRKVGYVISRKIQEMIYYGEPFAMEAPLFPEVKKSLAKLKGAGHPFFLISRRHIPEFGINLLKKHGLWGTYFNETNTFFVLNKIEKNQKAAALKIHSYVDDQPSVLDVLTAVPQKFLLDPMGVYEKTGIHIPVKSWDELTNLFFSQ